MNCHEVKGLALKYISGNVPFKEELQLRRHTVSCSDCRTYLGHLLEEERFLEEVLAASHPSFRRARRIVTAVLRSSRPVRRVRFVPALSTVRGAAIFVGAASLMLFAILALINQVSSPAVGKDGIDYHPIASHPALQVRLGLVSSSRSPQQTGEGLTDTYAELYQIAAEGLGEPVSGRQLEEAQKNPAQQKENPVRPKDGASVPPGRLMWKVA